MKQKNGSPKTRYENVEEVNTNQKQNTITHDTEDNQDDSMTPRSLKEQI